MQEVEGVHAANVTQWFKTQVEDISPPLEFTLIAGGHSNLTFSVKDSNGQTFVLRRPPLGHVLESAHDMGREHKIISGLAGSSVPVAKTFGVCHD
ncbi:MAG: phosphotransferase, partial [Pseudomonadales bacterium]|nr:phosphotransferase [Pseudomonadales bacterium]